MNLLERLYCGACTHLHMLAMYSLCSISLHERVSHVSMAQCSMVKHASGCVCGGMY